MFSVLLPSLSDMDGANGKLIGFTTLSPAYVEERYSGLQMFAHIPNLIYLSPASNEEFVQMFRYATTQKQHPVSIRVVDNLR